MFCYIAGIVPSSAVTTAMQVFSRLCTVWLFTVPDKEVGILGFRSKQMYVISISDFFISCLHLFFVLGAEQHKYLNVSGGLDNHRNDTIFILRLQLVELLTISFAMVQVCE
jgi:hypothetical protein